MVANSPRGAGIAHHEKRVARYSPGRLTAYTSQADELAIALIEAGMVVGMQ